VDGNRWLDGIDSKIHDFMVGSKGKHMVCMFVVRFKVSSWQWIETNGWMVMRFMVKLEIFR
jgi:hypothetical protein